MKWRFEFNTSYRKLGYVKEAISSYKQCVEFSNVKYSESFEGSFSMLEIALCNHQMYKYKKALKYTNMAIESLDSLQEQEVKTADSESPY